MQKYALFKRSFSQTPSGRAITFVALASPVDNNKSMVIEAENDPAAANKAGDMLRAFGTMTHSIRGNPDMIMSPFPDYFVGRLNLEAADKYDTEWLMFHIDTFTPVPEN
jgi:hypothetical protein